MRPKLFRALLASLAVTVPVLVLASPVSVTVPYTFSAGRPISASEVNADFTALATAVNTLGAAAGDLTLLQTTARSSLVDAINEVRAQDGNFLPLAGGTLTGGLTGTTATFAGQSPSQSPVGQNGTDGSACTTLTGGSGGAGGYQDISQYLTAGIIGPAPPGGNGAVAAAIHGGNGGIADGNGGNGAPGAIVTGGSGGMSRGAFHSGFGTGGSGAAAVIGHGGDAGGADDFTGIGGTGGAGATLTGGNGGCAERAGGGGAGVTALGGLGASGIFCGDGGAGAVVTGGTGGSQGGNTMGNGGAGVVATGGNGGIDPYGQTWGGNGAPGVIALGGNGGTVATHGAANNGGDGVFATGGQGNSGGSSGFAGNFQGNVNITGSVAKGAGTFRIDHPLDPENKVLYHSFVESPDMMNVYNGEVVLGANGEAVVELPAYFEALNKDFRYQLTCVGGYAPIYVAEKIHENRFKIAGGKEGLEVSWLVTGVRKDAFANAHRVQVEVEKRPEERGKFIHPVEHGRPESDGIYWEQIQRARGGKTDDAPVAPGRRVGP